MGVKTNQANTIYFWKSLITPLSEESDKRADTEAETAKKKVSAEKELALEVRKRAMETMGQTSKRSESGESEDVIKERKKGRSGGDTLQWLEKKLTEI